MARLTWALGVKSPAPQLSQHLDDPAGGDSLDVHLGQSKGPRLVSAYALLQGGRIEVAGTHLRRLNDHLS